jgi:hypothetical protein
VAFDDDSMPNQDPNHFASEYAIVRVIVSVLGRHYRRHRSADVEQSRSRDDSTVDTQTQPVLHCLLLVVVQDLKTMYPFRGLPLTNKIEITAMHMHTSFLTKHFSLLSPIQKQPQFMWFTLCFGAHRN